MINNYLRIAMRLLLRHKGYSAINIIGLAVGLASCILMMLWILDEVSYDRFHANAPDLYRIVAHWQDGDYELGSALQPVPMGPAVKAEFPEVQRATRFHIDGEQMIKFGDLAFDHYVVGQADPEALKMFSFPFASGDPDKALIEKFSVAISQTMSRAYFGENDPVGKTLSIDGRDFVVSAVLQDIPKNSHLQFDCLVPFDSRPDWLKEMTDTWRASVYYTYVQLHPEADLTELSGKCDELVARHTSEGEVVAKHSFQPITRIHLYHDVSDYLEGHGEIKYVYLFSSLALLTLLIACMNFINLSTARAARRAHEIGMRKVVGARRSDLIRQLLSESVCTAGMALLSALVLTELFLPVLNAWSEKQLSLASFENLTMLLLLGGLVLVTGLVSGVYPAVVISSFGPLSAIRQYFRGGRSGKSFRRILVVGQFALATGLITGATIIYQQLSFVSQKDLGFDRENLVYFTMRGQFTANYQVIKQELLTHPVIADVTAGRPPARKNLGSLADPQWKGMTKDEIEATWGSLAVDWNYLEAMGMRIVEGRGFEENLAADVTQGLVINEAARRVIGVDSPIGMKFQFRRHNFGGSGLELTDYEGTIVGVVKDFHYGSFHDRIDPVVLFIDRSQARTMCVRIAPGQTPEALTLLKEYWNQYAPDNRFEYYFVDESIDNFYRYERNLSRVLYCFTALAVFVSCLGLFGLASFMAESRTREIGVRKVLGASVSAVVGMLCREFVFLVIIGNLTVWPIAWYVMSGWLERFAYRIEIGLSPFALAGGTALILSLLSVGYQATCAAQANPVETLRHE